jgi:DNA repair ATPase RecN
LVTFAQSRRELLKRARSYELDAKKENRPQLEKALKELSAKKWLSQQREAVLEEVSRLTEIDRLVAAENLTNTRALSVKKSAVAEELVTSAYVNRFLEELKLLNAAHIPVELKKSRASTGRVFHKLFLKNCVRSGVRTSEILSEGEFRIISLAAFLADTRGRGTTTPFIFDDPISSLDQFYEDATAQRLAELCKSRQVIVFTHRLSARCVIGQI